MSQVFREGNVIGQDKVRVHRNGNRIDGVSHDNELFYADMPVPKRSTINLSFDRKLSFDMGKLIPIMVQECVPGDTFHIAQAHNLMFAPTIAPLYQRLDYRTYYFFCPNRLVSDKWKDIITLTDTSTAPAYFTCMQSYNTHSGDSLVGSLFDYMDLPVQESNFRYNTRHLTAYPFRAYQLIWNEFFRDEFKHSPIDISKTDGACIDNEVVDWELLRIGWERDYFTTCNTTPSVGSDVPMPSGSIVADGNFKLENNPSAYDSDTVIRRDVPGTSALWTGSNVDSSNSYKSQNYKSGLEIDNSTGGTINDLRIANHLQEYRDKLRIGGERYNESILAEYGVVVPDYRIQRPEYIGGYAQPIDTGAVFQTSPTSGAPLGTFAGRMSGDGKSDYIHYSALEHGYIIGLCTVCPRSSYYQGIPRMYMKDDVFDYYHPDFATLGDQPVYVDEIKVQSASSTMYPPYSRWGYNQRYLEYRTSLDRINGEFRTSMDYWHMGRNFSDVPTLEGSFVNCIPTNRIFAVSNTSSKIYAEIYQEVNSVRPMPISPQPNLTNVD